MTASALLAIASVTAILRDLLGNALIKYAPITRLGDVSVSVLPPDRITVGTDEASQLNLFLYKVTPYTVLRTPAPVGAHPVGSRSAPAPSLTLSLHYLVTAYGAQDFHEEILLGCAAHLFGTTPVLSREMVRKVLGPASGKNGDPITSPTRAALAGSALSDQFQEMRIKPNFLNFEDMSKLWSMLQARYRPSLTYEVSAVTMAGEA